MNYHTGSILESKHHIDFSDRTPLVQAKL